MGRVDDPGGIAMFAIIAVAIWMTVDLGFAGGALAMIHALGGFGGEIATQETVAGLSSVVVGLGSLFMLMFVVSGIAVLRWIYVTNRNAQAWSPFVSVTPGWNVGWFFVPVANLFKPFEGVRETYQASVNPDQPASVSVPIVMRLWWAMHIAGGVLGVVSTIISRGATTLPAIILTQWLGVLAFVLHAAEGVSLIAVVRGTTRVQRWRLGLAPA